MKIVLEGTTKEIAALVVAIQERQDALKVEDVITRLQESLREQHK
ncbi:hypothetical protein [Butyricicoccus pullicaecorum]|mgnify:FL=1|nr:hypothetical protein [Butyricicoccus pullicaecorum]